MKVTFDVDLEKFRYSLVGDGYTLKNVLHMSNTKLIDILCDRVNDHIETEYYRGKRLGLFCDEDDRNF